MRLSIFLSVDEFIHLKIKKGYIVPLELVSDNESQSLWVDSADLRNIYIDMSNEVLVCFFGLEYFNFLYNTTNLKLKNISCNIQQNVCKLTISGSDTLMNIYHTLEDRLLIDGFDKNGNVTIEGEIIEYLMDTLTF